MPKSLKILQAAAGSGKTFSLTAHYLTLLFSGENKYREILAVTFTNKATEEMKTRILEVLHGLAVGSADVESYRQLILKAHPTFSAEILKQKAAQVYRKILHDYSRFSVSTIDGFVQKVIRGFAFELGLNADYNLEMNYDKVKDDLVAKLDEALDHNKQLLQWIIDLAIERINDNKSWNYKAELYNLIGEIFKESFQVFEQAVETLGLDNIDELFKQYIQVTRAEIKNFEEQLMAIATQIYQVFEQYAVGPEQLKGKSRNGLAKAVLVARGDFSKIDALFKYIDNPDEWFQKNAEMPEVYASVNPLLQELQAKYLTQLPNYSLAIAFNKNLYYLRLMQEIAGLLKTYRSEHDNLLISDAQKLISGITDDAGDNPSFIWEKVGTRYRNFLFDEFQDTSTSQWNNFKSLLTNAMATPSQELIDHLIVGDTKQSIYRWRNGDWNILHKQAKIDVGIANVLEESLEENYRSAANIITFNNFLYKSIPLTLQKLLNENIAARPEPLGQWWQANQYHEIITGIYAGATQNFASKTLAGGTIKIRKFGKDESSPEQRFSETVFKEVALDDVIEEIVLLKKEKHYASKDIAILVRANSEALLVVRKLMARQLAVISGDALLISGNSCVQLIVNTLKVLTGIDAQTALYKANCIALYHSLHQKPVDANAYLNLTGTSLSALGHILPTSLCENWAAWLQLPLAELIENLIDCYALNNLSDHIPYLLAFRDLAGNATRLGEKGAVAFLNWWEEEGIGKSLPSPEGVDAIQVITIHKSKGLAFRAVFIPFCNWDIKAQANSIFWVSAEETLYKELKGIPLKFNDALADSAIAKAYYQELLFSQLDALNMLYVATTRTKDYLYIATMAKKDSSKISTMGDVLNYTFEQEFDENSRYEIVEDVAVKETAEKANFIDLDVYPTTSRLSELYVLPQEKHLKHLLNIDKSGRKGALMHDVLANAGTPAAVERYLDKLLLEGEIQESELPELQAGVMEVLNHPELQQILGTATESITEQNIIDANGKMHRPDRILFRPDEVIILDYKFTLEESDTHIAQVTNYKSLLMAMGYEHVKTYLFYAVSKKLKLV